MERMNAPVCHELREIEYDWNDSMVETDGVLRFTNVDWADLGVCTFG